MRKTFVALRQTFESSCSKTPQYLAFHRLFKRELTALLTDLGCTNIQISKPNHFDASGFFTAASGQAWYFRLEDLRWSKDKLLVRRVRDYKDYTGGMNQYVNMTTDALNFANGLRNLLVNTGSIAAALTAC
jgi:hypothetical protein